MTKRNMFEMMNAMVAAQIETLSAHASTANSKELNDCFELENAIAHELELLDKKAATAKTTPTKQQLANMELRQTIINRMPAGNPMTISDILAVLADDSLTNQRVTHIMTALVADGIVTREVVKRKAFYSLNEDA